MFFSKEQIEQSLQRLEGLNPFFGITFLVFKKQGLPVGEPIEINAIQVLGNFLQTYYRPTTTFEGFYTPLKTWNSKEKRWNSNYYANTLHVTATRTFRDVLNHPGGNLWSWKPDYIDILLTKHLRGDTIPTFDLAIWLFRDRDWENDTQPSDIRNAFFAEFYITREEQKLFDTTYAELASPWHQHNPVNTETLLNIIGTPPNSTMDGAILEKLTLIDVGPINEVYWELFPRLNMITGDNGLGKTFLLECAWWTLTGTWAEYQAFPRRDTPKETPSIAFQIGRETRSNKVQTVKYNWEHLAWNARAKRNVLPGLSIFAMANGSFAIWDPAKQAQFNEQPSGGGNLNAHLYLNRYQVWDGVHEPRGERVRTAFTGLIDDWVRWQNSLNSLDQTKFEAFGAAIQALSPGQTKELLVPGEMMRIPDEPRDIPTLKFPYGEVPIVLCSAGIQRILAMAYILIWAWHEHLAISELMRREPQQNIVLLIDEMEAHLHPQWQRIILPALLDVAQILSNQVQVQVIVATHSPLVLASVEPLFDDDKDALFHLHLNERGVVQLDKMPFIKRGSVDKWLISDILV